MRRGLLCVVGLGLLVLALGCRTGAGMAADLPRPRTFPASNPTVDASDSPLPEFRPPDRIVVPAMHPPDALTVAREPEPRWAKRLNIALMRIPPAFNWAFFALAVVF